MRRRIRDSPDVQITVEREEFYVWPVARQRRWLAFWAQIINEGKEEDRPMTS
jgi:hypothetical protein